MAVVWYSSWQMECCGEPFAVHDVVEWNLAPHSADDWLPNAVGDDLASRVTHDEDHHGLRGDARRHRGRVVGIRCASCRYAPTPGGDPRTLYPVVGTAVVVPVDRVDGREGLDGDLRLNGYLVDLELTDAGADPDPDQPD
ncbi:DUF6578 domain-containing protein [Phycicoccus sonneratiae]|uniref:Uncharacterized protein n=1 Tax=Phycicoccus sonneratiae TaxID=2807628 RepID=A0ABS2CMU1_9MICO|nr:DUF6578 domain-containing protein [Phycicoccus sonneraticus]MBM6401130.1 hypothetical protein [Phycicoccus sonneraticus]